MFACLPALQLQKRDGAKKMEEQAKVGSWLLQREIRCICMQAVETLAHI